MKDLCVSDKSSSGGEIVELAVVMKACHDKNGPR